MIYPIISADPAVQAHYELCRGKGTSHSLSVIFATGKAPGAVTDKEFFAGHRTLGDQFSGEEEVFQQLVDTAEKNGRKPHYTDHYVSALAAYPGDPEAFVPASEGRGHVKRVLQKRDWDSDGLVKNKSTGRTVRKNEPAVAARSVVR